MIGVPFDNNDLTCLGSITEVVADLVARRAPLLAELAAQHPTAPAAQDVEASQHSPATATTPDPIDQPNPLDDLIAAIRASVAPGISAEARAAGANACRAILTALEAQAGQPLAAAPPAPATPGSQLAAMLPHLAAMSREQLLAVLRDKFPAGTPAARPPQRQRVAGPRFHLIELPQLRRSGGGS